MAATKPKDRAGGDESAGTPDDQLQNPERACTERQANSELSSALLDRVGEDAEDADDGEQQGKASEGTDEHRAETRPGSRVAAIASSVRTCVTAWSRSTRATAARTASVSEAPVPRAAGRRAGPTTRRSAPAARKWPVRRRFHGSLLDMAHDADNLPDHRLWRLRHRVDDEPRAERMAALQIAPDERLVDDAADLNGAGAVALVRRRVQPGSGGRVSRSTRP
jgi:hypothetical protein